MYITNKSKKKRKGMILMKSAVEVREMLESHTRRMEGIEERIENKKKEMKMANYVGSMKSIMGEIEQLDVLLKEVRERLFVLTWVLNEK